MLPQFAMWRDVSGRDVNPYFFFHYSHFAMCQIIEKNGVNYCDTTLLSEKWYVHNIFTTFLQQILSDRLLLVVIIRVKN